MSGQNETISLTVEKSIPSDVGHGRARISGDSGLDLKPGDIVLIKGEKRSLRQFTGAADQKITKWPSSE
ncbi:MAG: hypothetical protein CM15mP3_07890 [Candidatus Poseidoniales archaeon]|nr:MAG: hypothetical protein CM15mP3_07890 [Candidatus Poseidoniales archaeon]